MPHCSAVVLASVSVTTSLLTFDSSVNVSARRVVDV